MHSTGCILQSCNHAFAALDARAMLELLLGIPRHLSWTTYARVSSNNRLLPAIHFFIPKAATVQRWYAPSTSSTRGSRLPQITMSPPHEGTEAAVRAVAYSP